MPLYVADSQSKGLLAGPYYSEAVASDERARVERERGVEALVVTV